MHAVMRNICRYDREITSGMMLKSKRRVAVYVGHDQLDRVHRLDVCYIEAGDVLFVIEPPRRRHSENIDSVYAYTLCIHSTIGLITVDVIGADRSDQFDSNLTFEIL